MKSEQSKKKTSQRPSIPKCCQEKEAQFICFNAKCAQKCVFICDLKACECSQNHRKCLKSEYESLIFSLEEKKKDSLPLQKMVEKIFTESIDYLSELRDKYLLSLRYYGLQQCEERFLEKVDAGLFDSLDKYFITSIVKNISHYREVDAQKTVQNLEKHCKKNQNNFKIFFEKIGKICQRQSSAINFNFQNSNIIKNQQQVDNLVQMIEDANKNSAYEVKKLYTASQNAFSTNIFHQKCDNIPNTLVLVETEHGKKIGGFTPIKWDKTKKNTDEKDPSMETFLFSMSNNEKFTLKPQSQAIIQYANAGPTFGKGPSDLYIKDDAKNINIYGNIGSSFTHKDYKVNDQNSWMRFSGAQEGKEFKVTQWEVYQILFD